MKINVEAVMNKGISLVTIEHPGEVPRTIATGSYISAAIPNRDHLFEELNEYLMTWPAAKQQELWDIYSRVAENLYADDLNHETLTANIGVEVKRIFELANYDSLKMFVYRANFNYPTDLSDTYQEFTPTGRNVREKTYIKSEYREMVALALAMRLMIPIWGHYIQLISPYHGNYYKEVAAVKLLDYSDVKSWPPYIRMREYVAASVDGDASLSTLMGGLTTDEIPDHLLCLALVRKIAVGVLSVTSDKESLPRILFNYIIGTHNRLDDRFSPSSGRIVEKKMRAGDNEEDNSSVWDMMTQTTEVSDGDIKLLDVSGSVYLDVHRERVAPELSMARVQQCISACSRQEQRVLEWWQKAMVYWVIRTLPPDCRELLQKKTQLGLIGLVQAVLDSWEFYELAILVSAYRVPGSEMAFMPGETRNKISREQMAILNEMYPHYRQEAKRHDPTKRTNVAAKAIDQMVEAMTNIQWKPLAPRNIVERIPMLTASGFMYVSGDIKQQLAAMIIRVNNQYKGK